MGRLSSFWISFVLLVNSFGLLIIFFSSFGDSCAVLMTQIFWRDVPEDEKNFGMTRACWAIVLAVCVMPFVLRKELAELKVISMALFGAAIVFVIVNVF